MFTKGLAMLILYFLLMIRLFDFNKYSLIFVFMTVLFFDGFLLTVISGYNFCTAPIGLFCCF